MHRWLRCHRTVLPQIDYVDMDGPLLLREDIATGLQYEIGIVTITNKPGLGIEINAALFSKLYRHSHFSKQF